MRLLASHPYAGHLRRDLTPLPVKFWSVFSYLIVYDPAAKPLAIARVFHGRRGGRTILNARRSSTRRTLNNRKHIRDQRIWRSTLRYCACISPEDQLLKTPAHARSGRTSRSPFP